MNKTVFIIRNQDELYLDTQDQWVTPDSELPPFHSPHKDVALNKLFEMTLADATLRGKVDSCPADAKGKPVLSASAGHDDSQAGNTSANDSLEAADAAEAPGA